VLNHLLSILAGLNHWQICGLVIYLLWQAVIIPSMPEEIMIPTLGILWSQGRITFWEGLFSVQIGIMVGDLILMSMGRFLGLALLKRRPFSMLAGPDTVNEATEQVRKRGAWLIFITRFTPMVRAPIFFAAGLSRMSPWVFFRSDYIASCIFIPGLMYVGMQLGANAHSLEQAFRILGTTMATLFVSGLTYAYFKEKKRAQLTAAPESLL
jgi:membrane protein DedA with SNARE-associated domain